MGKILLFFFVSMTLFVSQAYSQHFQEQKNENLYNHIQILLVSCQSNEPPPECYSNDTSFILPVATSTESASIIRAIDSTKTDILRVGQCTKVQGETKCIISPKMSKAIATGDDLDPTLEVKKRISRSNSAVLETLLMTMKTGSASASSCDKTCVKQSIEKHRVPSKKKGLVKGSPN